MIPSYCHTDDRRIEVNFDATPWFSHASDKEITDLAACGFGGDYPADEVAIWMADYNADVARMFLYIEAVTTPKHSEGFECHVDERTATAWVKKHRPYLVVDGHIRMEPWSPKDWSPLNRKPKNEQ